MTCDPRIICFSHCNSKNVFCKSVPERCPLCRSYIIDYKVEPFAIPYPYKNAVYHPSSLVIRPSQGNFLNDYNILDDLHIGITNSEGIVFEYDIGGIIVNNHSKWTNSIILKIIPLSWESHWDKTLEKMLKDVKWTFENYDEISMNCFSFVIEFLNNLQYINMRFVNKEDICNKLILSKIQDAVKYNSIFKKLKNNDYLIS
ncbi:MKRN2 opposite strand protein-like [Calliopsis andreniformis]|uniref:MKRN2 opposite strand protein-like n=1 Tax=Calliopsis andreniformis TaxID=337506 RepID=UPI003FCC46D4